ncbi:uncharacterized protein DUF397 [Stackebrandtia albiflava]|uniref:Uncharacterized protein DUF397 n=1 Tax=Stackebrandtia albiflava TaxID=406432 RepID=A0A562V2B4_9ACTN|nr:DUF397 domain-containing protein [Stackebrandtia albiflava]TWJ11962.1 uncharacterized protein DUF397 [Stackebrandtia albiflava]
MTNAPPPAALQWRRSLRSASGGNANCVEVAAWTKRRRSGSGANGANCVEVGVMLTGVAVRDSKAPSGPVLTTSAANWRGMLTAIKNSDVDS